MHWAYIQDLYVCVLDIINYLAVYGAWQWTRNSFMAAVRCWWIHHRDLLLISEIFSPHLGRH